MSGTVQDQLQWLVRKSARLVPAGQDEQQFSAFMVLGPYLTDQVRSMVSGAMLEAEDELCPENGYWFAVSELAEVKRLLGLNQVSFAKSASSDSETTQPDLETTEPDFDPGPARDIADEKTPPGIETPRNLASDPEATGVVTVRRPAARQPTVAIAGAQPAGSAHAAYQASVAELSHKFKRVTPGIASVSPEDQVRAHQVFGMERGRIWAILTLLGGVFAIIGVLWVIRSLRV